MAVRVVDAFEEINVDEQERARDPVTPPAFEFLTEGGAEAAAVSQPGQVVAVGLGA
jgi:hypothetical protein